MKKKIPLHVSKQFLDKI